MFVLAISHQFRLLNRMLLYFRCHSVRSKTETDQMEELNVDNSRDNPA